MEPKISPSPIALRVFPAPEQAEQSFPSRKAWQTPEAMLVFDTETSTDATQCLKFGSYRFFREKECLEEGLFYADDLADSDRQILEKYITTRQADTPQGSRQLRLLTLREFLQKFYGAAYKGRCLIVGFNLPFDLSRIAYDCASARGRFAGGFSLGIWSYIDKLGRESRNQYRPRIGIKRIDSKRALKGFTGRSEPDKVDLIPDDSATGEPEEGHKFRGHFLDLRTLAFALTDRGYSLETACQSFGVEHGKQSGAVHGVISEEYVDYNRRDVLATSELAFKLIEEYSRHPIKLQLTRAYSPASIGKAYLRAMGIKPILGRQPNFPKKYLGHAQSAFYGGRTSAHIRKVVVPIAYTDFLSMYPTVNNLMGLWSLVIADEITVEEHCQGEVEEFLRGLRPEDLFKPVTWKFLSAFVQIIPDGDILPSRAKYSRESNDWQVAVNHIYADNNDRQQALWFSLPDVVASVLLTGRIPKIVDAFRIEARNTASELKPIKLRGVIDVDPSKQDFFKVAIEERKSLGARADLSNVEKERLDKALKVLANATSYGIYAEMNRQESDREVQVTCHGIDAEPFSCRVAHPDVPGEYCFPPLAALITGAARLMLALLEHSVSELGGTYAMEDTDSMAIVATERGGLVPCAGGPCRMSDGQRAIMALSWEQVKKISERFAALNPYDRGAIPGSILKIEEDNFEPATGKQRQLYCLAISAKRYAPFLLNQNGEPVLLRKGANNVKDRWSQHGLGQLLNPTDPESDDREWISQVWLSLIRKALHLPAQDLKFHNLPAIGRVAVSSPAVMRALVNLNRGKKYADQIKPFNFLLTCYVKQFGHPWGADAEHFHLIAPYASDPSKWLKMDWVDQYTGNRYRIGTADNHGTRQAARVKTYGEVLQEYEFHPEAKCADAEGMPCGKQTIGLLQRRHVEIEQIKYIGKESNSLEAVESGMVHSTDDVYTEYCDPRRDEWQTKILPALKRIKLDHLVKECAGRMSRRALIDLRAARSRPHPKNQEMLASVVGANTYLEPGPLSGERIVLK